MLSLMLIPSFNFMFIRFNLVLVTKNCVDYCLQIVKRQYLLQPEVHRMIHLRTNIRCDS
jgi:hypothetical protein